jgi:serine/threonine protein phosphatase PrpC
MRVSGTGLSDRGRVRPHNEDALLVDLAHGVFAVADGMGGHAAGEVASSIAIEALTERLARPRADGVDVADMLRDAIEESNRRIAVRSDESPDCRHMGTTVVVAVTDGDGYWIAHVGDSRAYLVRDGEIHQLTSDHSFVNELVRLGMLSREQAARDPRRNVVTRALGSGTVVAPDILEGRARHGDVVILCSDGLNTMLDDHQILEVATGASGDIGRICTGLVDTANQAGGEDNITVIVLGFEDPIS